MPGTLRSLTDRFLATLILHPFRRARQPEEMWGFGLSLQATSSRGRCLLARRMDARSPFSTARDAPVAMGAPGSLTWGSTR